MPRYLTKSRFKLAHECETKLYYTKKEKEYADQSMSDSFLASLAEGGFQVGELAKYYFCDNPEAESITIDTLDYDQALFDTEQKITQGCQVIAEAAFRHENLFIRTDICCIDTVAKQIDLYEVKAKSYISSDKLMNIDRKSGEVKGVSSKWESYLYDVAFQKWVLKKCYPNYKICAHLMMADKEAIATVDGLNQCFKIDKVDGRTRIAVKDGLTRNQLGNQILKAINVDNEVQWIWENPVETSLKEACSFEEYISLLSHAYANDQKLIVPIGSKCKKCQFRTTPNQTALQSGFVECWKNATRLNETALQKPLVSELWCGGGYRGMNSLIENEVYLLEQLNEALITPKSESKTEYKGLSPLQRRVLQIEAVQSGSDTVFLDKEGLIEEMSTWVYPLHFIDFETSRVAIPFHAGRKPYEQIAFQFSHHIVREDYSIEHIGEYISFEAGVFPNYDFARALKAELENDNGTIFRYHNHENSVLCDIYNQLTSDTSEIADRADLLQFIQSITHRKNEWIGDRDMIDLFKLVTSYYYPPTAGGSNSIKHILPATIRASEFLQQKYSKPVYGTHTMPSKNFVQKVWLKDNESLNPYKALPPVFDEWDNDLLDNVMSGVEEVADGGAALTAYSKLQFSQVPEEQRILLRNALLKYCELDTLAMVMIWEYWMQCINVPIS